MANRRNFLKQFSGVIIAAAGSSITDAKTPYIQTLKLVANGSASKRVFFARFAHETNTFHPVPTSCWQFSEAGGIKLKSWANADLSIIPGVSATPNGGGLLLEKPCREAIETVLDSLRKAMPVDAVFLNLHGAMYAEGVGHAETVLAGKVRELVGPKIPVACTFDLHGNIPVRMGQYGDILVGLKTAPHTDGAETAEIAARILLDTIQGRVHPISYVLPIPFIVQGEKAMTTSEPFGSLVAEAKRIEKEGIPGFPQRILAATLFVGCAWTDAPDTGMSVMITADGSLQAAQAAATYLAQKIWDARYQFNYGCETAELEEGVSRALASNETTVFLTDSGDNVTASTPGDLPIVLRHLVERNINSAVVACINDTVATEKCFEAGEGTRIHLSIGATIEKRYGPPLEAEVDVLRLIQQPKMAVIKTGGVEVILTDRPSTFTHISQFEQCGINPLERKIAVVKMGYLYPDLTRVAPRYIMLLTPGAGDMRIEKLTYSKIRRPIFPLDSETQFDPPKINL
jgi:microcystin degradation protein MlrC